jgi:hypothetical protein
MRDEAEHPATRTLDYQRPRYKALDFPARMTLMIVGSIRILAAATLLLWFAAGLVLVGFVLIGLLLQLA